MNPRLRRFRPIFFLVRRYVGLTIPAIPHARAIIDPKDHQILKTLTSLATAAFLLVSAIIAEEAPDTPAALDFTLKTLAGEAVALASYQGRVLLVVNTASKCGLTPQYRALQALHEKYAKDGLAVLGFPCNQFGKQEPGTAAAIKAFCTQNHGVTFDMFSKIEVNGEGACDFYKHLTALETKPKGPGRVSWNFEKFLIGRRGNVVARFAPRTKPEAKDVTDLIEAELAKK